MSFFLQNKRIIILGCNSFAASALTRKLLLFDATVLGINRSPENLEIFCQHKWGNLPGKFQFIQADLNKDLTLISSIINNFQPEIVIDFAGQGMVAESWQNPEQWYSTNIVSKVRIHELLRKIKGLEKYIRISTPEVYGSSTELIKENWIYNPTTPYAVSHAAIDMSLKAFHQQYNFPVIITRFANFYGEGQQLYRIIPRTILYGLMNKKLQLHGGGSSVRAFIHGSDVADGIVNTLLRGITGQIYHFTPKKFYTIKEVVELIFK